MELEFKGKFDRKRYECNYADYRIEDIGKIKGQVRLEKGRLIITINNLLLSKKLKEVFEENEKRNTKNN